MTFPMRRRAFIAALGGTVAWPMVARAQQTQMPLIGFLCSQSADTFAQYVTAFRVGLNETGYDEHQNVAIEYLWAEGHYDRLPRLAAELVEHRPAVIAATGGTAVALAAKAATATIPIVFEVGFDPVAAGLVTSLNHPTGNVTGVARTLNTLGPKLLEMLHELVPTSMLIAVLVNPQNPTTSAYSSGIRDAADAIGQKLLILDASNENEIDDAFATLTDLRSGALVVETEPFFNSRRDQIVALAARNAVPAIYAGRAFVTAGGLMSYSVDLPNVFRETSIYVGRIVAGAKAADLPVMRAVKIELVLNLNTAKALGVTFPPSLLARADEVIE
jgi:putative tryptophan/tyrosine transport system substrate-binding protein